MYVILAPFVSFAIGGIFFSAGMGISFLNELIGLRIAIVGGVYLAPCVYGLIAFRRSRSIWVGAASAAFGMLGNFGLSKVL